MKRTNLILMIMVITGIFCMYGCSGSDSPVLPDTYIEGPANTASQYNLSENDRYLWALGEAEFNTDTGQIELIPARDSQIHYNILTFLENGPCFNCIQITNTEELGSVPGWAFDIRITHPFDDPRFTGFDVRMVLIFRATWHWEYSEIYMSNLASGNPELINADGMTCLYQSWTEGMGPMGLQGYQAGNWATEYYPGSDLNGFVRYESDFTDNTRNAFLAGDSVTNTLEIQFPPDFPTVWRLGYAVDASYAPPAGTGEDLSDFPPEANCPEPYDIVISKMNVGGGMDSYGGSVILKIKVYEHDSDVSHLAPVIEAPDICHDLVTAKFSGYEGGFVPVWYAEIKNQLAHEEGTYRILVSVEDALNQGSPDHLDLTYYELFEIEVADYIENYGWAQTWGYTDNDRGTAVQADMYGNVYVGGTFENAVDFHPGYDDVVVRTSNGHTDCFLCKYDETGKFKWVQTWGGEHPDYVNDLAITSDGEIYVVGSFGGTVDFDPSDEFSYQGANGTTDAYLTMFDFTGNWHWAKKWGGTGEDDANGISFNNDRLYVAGNFQGSTDFGSGGTASESNGLSDAYVIRLDPVAGDNIWSATWGGDRDDSATDVCYVHDWDYGEERLYVCGYFTNNADSSGIDFDPGTGECIRTSWGQTDAFVSKFDGDTAQHELTYTWGAGDADCATGVIADFINGWAVGGYISGVVDFDPSTNEHWSNYYGLYDAFIVGFEVLEDEFVYGFNWGGPGFDWVKDIDSDLWGNPFVVGAFSGTVDFDPTIDSNSYSSNGEMDCFISSFQVDGSYYSTYTWGGPFSDEALAVSGGEWTDTFTIGYFNDTVNFSPETEPDNHASEGADDAFLMRNFGDGSW